MSFVKNILKRTLWFIFSLADRCPLQNRLLQWLIHKRHRLFCNRSTIQLYRKQLFALCIEWNIFNKIGTWLAEICMNSWQCHLLTNTIIFLLDIIIKWLRIYNGLAGFMALVVCLCINCSAHAIILTTWLISIANAVGSTHIEKIISTEYPRKAFQRNTFVASARLINSNKIDKKFIGGGVFFESITHISTNRFTAT